MIEDYFLTNNYRYLLWGLFAFAVVFLVFHAGVVVGEHQPSRNHALGNHPSGPLGGFMPQEGFIGGHGAVGTVATVTLPTFIMVTRGGVRQLVETGEDTMVTGGPTNSTKDIQTGETVIVLGDPQELQNGSDLDARVIKILPPQGDDPGIKVNLLY